MSLPDDESSLYSALIARDPAYDGFFYAAVRSTGVFCRLTCPARKPKRANTVFFSAREDAMRAGFRPCQRCRPLDPSRPTNAVLEALRARVQEDPERRWTAATLADLGYDESTVRRAFKREYGITFAQFARAQRIGIVVSRMKDGGSVIDAQLDAGYESPSGFRDAVNRLLGDTPARARARTMLTALWIDTPLGAMLAIADTDAIHMLRFADGDALAADVARMQKQIGPVCFGSNAVLNGLSGALGRYFAGEAALEGIPLAACGNPSEDAVRVLMLSIPVGHTRALRQVGGATDTCTEGELTRTIDINPLAIIVPCHRVMTGAIGPRAPWRRQWLLQHELRFRDDIRQKR